MDFEFDVLVIGAGVLGCFTARNLMRYNLKVALLERNPDVCMEISRANTAVVYAGYDTKPGTLKTELCLKANKDFAHLCEELDVDFVRCGSLMVAYGKGSVERLQKKLEQGAENGVAGLRLLNRQETLALEPNLSPDIMAALYAPTVGTVNPWALGIAAAENAVENGARIFLNHNVSALQKTEGGYLVSAGGRLFKAGAVVNCAGLSADKVSELAAKPYFRLKPTRGEYLLLDGKATSMVRHVIFQEKEDNGKGITIVPTTEGNMLIGASESAMGDEESFVTTTDGLKHLQKQAEELVPSLSLESMIRSFGSLRPNAFWTEADPETEVITISDKSITSFIINEPEDMPGLINLAGIKTPGLTCANEIGKYTAGLVLAHFGNIAPNPHFNPVVEKRVRFARLPLNEQQALAQKKPAYGRIVCRCGQITEGEVVAAIRMKVGATTVDGVKRRASTCLGRCQGGFCTERVMEILARELHTGVKDIRKDKANSYIIIK